MKNEKDLDTYFNNLASRYYKKLQYDYKKNIEIAISKKAFIENCIAKARKNYILVQSDTYLTDMIEIFREQYNLKKPMTEILSSIQKVRKEWKQQQLFGEEYNQPYIPVVDFVSEERDKEILKFIIQHLITLKFFRNVLEPEKKKLEDNVKPQPETPRADPKRLSFKWHGGINAEEQMKELHRQLKDEGFITADTKLKDFKAIFRGTEIKEPVKWNEDLGELVYLINELSKQYLEVPAPLKAIIKAKELSTTDKKNLSKWINERIFVSFRDKNGKAFSKDRIKDAKNYYENKKLGSNKPKRGDEIDSIVSSLLSAK